MYCHSKSIQLSAPEWDSTPGGRGNQIIFWWWCEAQGLKPLPISKDFYPLKNGWFDCFFKIFTNRDPFLRVFLPQNSRFYNFCEMGLSSKDFFFTKMGSMSKDFWWKSNPFGRHVSICLNMWVPPMTVPRFGFGMDVLLKFESGLICIPVFLHVKQLIHISVKFCQKFGKFS